MYYLLFVLLLVLLLARVTTLSIHLSLAHVDELNTINFWVSTRTNFCFSPLTPDQIYMVIKISRTFYLSIERTTKLPSFDAATPKSTPPPARTYPYTTSKKYHTPHYHLPHHLLLLFPHLSLTINRIANPSIESFLDILLKKVL